MIYNKSNESFSTVYSDYEYLLKILIIGNSCVGKSSLLERYVDDTFKSNHMFTIGADFKIKTLVLDQSQIKLQIWDTAGQERFKTLTSMYYRGAHGILFVYDTTDKESFVCINNWINESRLYTDKTIPKILIGNKKDLKHKREISYEDGETFAHKHGMLFIETSAKESENVNDAFLNLAKRIKEYINSNTNDMGVSMSMSQSIRLHEPPKKDNDIPSLRDSCCGN